MVTVQVNLDQLLSLNPEVRSFATAGMGELGVVYSVHQR